MPNCTTFGCKTAEPERQRLAALDHETGRQFLPPRFWRRAPTTEKRSFVFDEIAPRPTTRKRGLEFWKNGGRTARD